MNATEWIADQKARLPFADMGECVTDAMVETAAQIMWDTETGPGNWDELPEDGRDLECQAMRAALEAAAPLIAAKALRDAADAAARTSGGYGWVGDSVRDWLRTRADRIEHDARCPHRRCPGTIGVCCCPAVEA